MAKSDSSSEKKPGLWQRLFGKSQPVPTASVESESQFTYDYSVLPELARILTNKNAQAEAEMLQLAESVSLFVQHHQSWCEELDFTDFVQDKAKRQEETLLLFSYWLAGYGMEDDSTKEPKPFAAYIDWKEETEDIIWKLEMAKENLGYDFSLENIKFDNSEFTDKVLEMIDDFLSTKGFTLCALDTQSDSYHLFMLAQQDFANLQLLGGKVGFRFYREFV
jgi:hypothetical protein